MSPPTPLPQAADVAAPPPPPPRAATSRSYSTSPSTGQDISLLDYEVAELTWENGQLTMHGLGLPRVPSKPHLASGTLESIVNQATTAKDAPPPPHHGGACLADDDLVPWFHAPSSAPAASVSMTMDALVPTDGGGGCGGGVGCSATRVGSCSAAARVPAGSDWSVSASESTMRESMQRWDTCRQMSGGVNGLASTSFAASPENTKTATVDDHDSVCHSRPQKERGDDEENEKKGTYKSSLSTKRSRAAAIHNQSERKRRDKINQRMKTLQKLVPNSSKTDKASMLDEVIDYLKQLQAQVQMMNRMSFPSMMMPMAIQQQLQMSMMSQMGMGMSMGVGMGMAGMGMGMGMGAIGMDQMNMNINQAMAQPQNVSGMNINPSTFMPLVTWDGTSTIGAGDRVSSQQPTVITTNPLSTYLASQQLQQQAMTLDAYNKMASMYQQLQQHQQQQQQQLQQQQVGRPNSDT